MKRQSGDCPPESVLTDFGLGKLDEASAETIAQHIETCVDCRDRVANLPGDTFVARLQDAGVAPVVKPTEAWEDAASAKEKPAKPATDGAIPPELTSLPDYDNFKKVGRGGMGVVYLAHNRALDRWEVLKAVNQALFSRPEALKRFQLEIRSAARLRHPNIVAAYSVFRAGGLLIFAMEYVRGKDLSQVVKQRGALPVPNAAFYAYQAAVGLQHAHGKGMVHRDIKPNNMMLAIEGKKHVVKILDFGLAKATSENAAETALTRTGQMLGTPDFIAPEQILDARQADIRADIYSLGCTLYYLLSGKPPFEETSLYGILQAHQTRDALRLDRVRDDVPPELADIIARMMAKDPMARYQTPAEAAKALIPFFKPQTQQADGKPSALSAPSVAAGPLDSAPPPPQAEQQGVILTALRPMPGGHRPWSRPIMLAGVAGVAIIVLTAITFLATRKRASAPDAEAPQSESRATAATDNATTPAAALRPNEFEARSVYGPLESRALVEALASPVKKSLDGITVADLLRDLRDDYQIDVFLDQRTLSDNGASTDTKLAPWNASRGSLEQALDAMLDPLGLSWTARRSRLLIVRKEWARVTGKRHGISAWSLSDLAAYRTSAAITRATVQPFVESVQQVKPASWDAVGGPGSLKPGEGVLFVHQSSEIQREIEQRFSRHLVRIEPDVWAFPQSDAVRKALLTKADLSFEAVPLRDVLDAMAKKHDLGIELNTDALTDAGVPPQTPITIDLRRQPLDFALERLLWPLDLRYFVDGEVVFVTTATQEENELRPIEYDASDAVQLFGDIDSVVAAIEALVWPTTWGKVGGPAQVLVLPDRSTLSIDQIYAAHAELHEFFALARAATRDGSAVGVPAAADARQAQKRDASKKILYAPPGLRDVVKALASPVKRSWNEATLAQFAQDLRDDFQIHVYVDEKALADAAIGTDDPFVKWSARRGTLEVALHGILAPVYLSWTFHQGNLWITTAQENENLQQLAAYRTGHAIIAADSKAFIKTVEKVKPLTWDTVGGAGSLTQVRELRRSRKDLGAV
jgi:hypothetical protein